MKSITVLFAAGLAAASLPAHAADGGQQAKAQAGLFTPDEVRSAGSVTIGGRRIGYTAMAGTLVVHAKGWDDAAVTGKDAKADADEAPAEASMFYAAYFRDGVPAASRPITFVFNGGPGSSSLWLHMGAFGPVRVVVSDGTHTPAAPYSIVSNDQSLLDVSDVVFVDAPGTGFSRIAGKDKDKAFYGVDQDIHAFAMFIRQFLSKYNRWNSPKYLFGESYGTMRAAGLTLALQQEDIDLNGTILLSNILNWDTMPDDPQLNPSIDEPYIVALPTYAATAWYHDKLPNKPADLEGFLARVEHFATTEYAAALMQGNDLPDADRQAMARKLHDLTGLPVSYLIKTNLRIEYGAFQKELLAGSGLTTGTLDTRFTGPTLDPLSKVAEYDPQSAGISSAYVAALNTYVRQTLHYGAGKTYKAGIDVYSGWDYRHRPPGSGRDMIALPNVLPDLAAAMKQNPTLKVMVNGGYFDVSTPYFEGKFELRHLPVSPALQKNIEYRYYRSGHMVYVNPKVLAELHANVADFIRRTDGVR
ncbi:peptidase S10 [Novosphingobium sp. ZN18A2]|uniref:S10 family peptidase n=1 Tax=Novosphingobium sp. ZN18A2 TaxID=3079861 RepID=UPI0030D5727E